MNRIVFAVVFALGLATVGWVGMGFVGSSGLALLMTLVIGAVYLLGAFEVLQFRAATAALSAALADVAQPLTDLAAWLQRLPAPLQHPVRLRIEGERAALPGLALTPYLVGLLVMLGMLGTFLGMVLTFKGAVFALEGSTDLQAIRSALAAPIKGLGLAFGTSVAGVAASAMLGLLSAMARRERVDVARLLDTRAATVFKPLSLGHQRQQAYQALQVQAQALPQVVERLQAMVDGMERRSAQLETHLQGQQAQFHREVSGAYTELAARVGASLQDSLAAGAQAAGDSIKPVVQAAMAEMALESKRMHQSVFEATQSQLAGLSGAFGDTARGVSDGWTRALQTHASTSAQQVEKLDLALQSFAQVFEQRANALLTSVGAAAVQSQSEQHKADQQRLQSWTQGLASMAASLQAEWQQAGAQTLAQQQAVCQTLEKTAGDISARASAQASQAMADVSRLLAQSEALVQTRIDAEAHWAQQQGERMEQLASLWRTELTALREAEAQRGQAAVDRLAELQTALASHLSSVHDVTAQSQSAQAAADQQRLQAWTQGLAHMADTLKNEWQQAGAETLAQQNAVCLTLEKTAGEITTRVNQQAGQTLDNIAALLDKSESLVSSRVAAEAQWAQQQGERMDQLAGLWRSELSALRSEEATRGQAAVQRLGELQTALASHLASLHEVAAKTQSDQAFAEQQRLQAWTQGLETMASTLRNEWQQVGAQTLSQQTAVCLTLEKTAGEITERVNRQASQTLGDIAGLLDMSESLIVSRVETEARWTEQQGQRMDELAALWRSELGALRADEATRGQAAVERLGELQSAVASQLATLGAALEQPMTRLMQTAAEVPQAAAEVIGELRGEMSRFSERDNQALAERAELLENISTLLQSLNQASGEQRAAIESLVASAEATLGQASSRFAETLGAQAGSASDAAAHVAGSAVELASLGEAFNHGVQLFSASNEKLIDSLGRMEAVMGQAASRSDEQLAYYVAQAREVIDLSIASQQGLVEDLRRRDAKAATTTAASKETA
ncbi:DUF802 domain-containing protein [Variovorax sp. HJSM1_2]|uniref:DUF802 domain-containing protein n=1 Tax=Variovorax sp. HJSM1_2 TaxID=3366263 RepID=UPI003BBB6409